MSLLDDIQEEAAQQAKQYRPSGMLWNYRNAELGLPLVKVRHAKACCYDYIKWGEECQDALAVDIETNGEPWWSGRSRIRMVGVCDGDQTVNFNPGTREGYLAIAEIGANERYATVMHNSQFDLLYLMLAGLWNPYRGIIHDTISMARVAYNLERKVGLDYLGKKYCKEGKVEVKKPWELDWDSLATYNAKDAEITWLLFNHYLQRRDQAQWWGTYVKELELVPSILGMYRSGINLDFEWCLRFILTARQQIQELEKPFTKINHRSPDQVSGFLYGKGGLTKPSHGQPKGKKGHYSTAEAWLVRHLTNSKESDKTKKVLRGLLDLRSWEKDAKYVEKLVEFAREDGRIHTTLLPYTAMTGRWSSKKPNLQQIPGKPHHVRHAFYYTDPWIEGEYELWSFDYDQMEIRMAAAEAGETSLLEAFREGRDIHMETARLVTHGNRDHAKVVIYAFIYGSGAQTMAETLRVPVEQAEQWIMNFRSRMPKIYRFMRKMKTKMAREGALFTKTGRKFRCLEDYQATDYYIQGSGADILKWKCIELCDFLQDKKSKLVLCVHDELVFAIHKSEKRGLLKHIQKMMEVTDLFAIPLTVSYGLFYEKD